MSRPSILRQHAKYQLHKLQRRLDQSFSTTSSEAPTGRRRLFTTEPRRAHAGMAPAAELLGRTTSATAALGSDIGSGMAEKVRMLEEEVAALQEKARAEAAEAASKARILEGKVAAQEVVHAAQLKASRQERWTC